MFVVCWIGSMWWQHNHEAEAVELVVKDENYNRED
jgi:hypothetical protein